MRKLLAMAVIAVSPVVTLAEGDGGLKTDEARLGYSIGVRYGQGLGKDLKAMDLGAFVQGLTDGFKQQPLKMTNEEMQQAVTAFQQKMQQQAQEKMEAVSHKNMTEGKAFLAENGKKKGVYTLPSGLQYQVIEEGSGDKPKGSDTVTVHYHGTLIDGTVFDSSVERGQPAQFGVKQVIPGWTEALQLMTPGSKWKLFIPSDLAYGERGAGQKIGPHQTLVFEVELIKIGG